MNDEIEKIEKECNELEVQIEEIDEDRASHQQHRKYHAKNVYEAPALMAKKRRVGYAHGHREYEEQRRRQYHEGLSRAEEHVDDHLPRVELRHRYHALQHDDISDDDIYVKKGEAEIVDHIVRIGIVSDLPDKGCNKPRKDIYGKAV